MEEGQGPRVLRAPQGYQEKGACPACQDPRETKDSPFRARPDATEDRDSTARPEQEVLRVLWVLEASQETALTASQVRQEIREMWELLAFLEHLDWTEFPAATERRATAGWTASAASARRASRVKRAPRVSLGPLGCAVPQGRSATLGKEERMGSPDRRGCQGRRVCQASRVSLALRELRENLPSPALAPLALRVNRGDLA